MAFTSAITCLAFAGLISDQSAVRAHLIPPLAIVAAAVATYAWVVYQTAGASTVTVALWLCVLWAWAAQQSWELGLTAAAFAVLIAVAAGQRRRRAKRSLRMEQLLDDLREDHTVKDQAVALATQTCENLEKKYGRYLHLQTIAERLSNLLELDRITHLAVNSAFELIGKSEVCLLFLVDRDRQELSLTASRKSDAAMSVRAKHGDQFDRYVLRTHRPLLVNDVRRDFRFTAAMAGGAERPVSSVIACPLLVHRSAEGVLRLDSPRPGAYTQDDLRFLDILLDLLGTAVTNAHLFATTQRLAMTDGLTGLLLRRPLLEHLARELQRAERSGEPAAVLLFDLDHFKAYNDAFGHTAGDVVLKGVADVLRAVVPPDGVSGRYGGEEFAVLLPRATRQQARELAEAIRAAVERNLARVARGASKEREQLAVTASAGVALFPDDAQADLELIRVADQRLYEAKRAGRNRVVA